MIYPYDTVTTLLLQSVPYFFSLHQSFFTLCTVFGAASSTTVMIVLINPSVNPYMFGNFNVCHKNGVTYSSGTDRLVELCYNFSITNDLTRMVKFPTQIPD